MRQVTAIFLSQVKLWLSLIHFVKENHYIIYMIKSETQGNNFKNEYGISKVYSKLKYIY